MIVVWELWAGVAQWRLLLLLLLFLVVLHVRCEGGCRVIAPIADGALEGLSVVVRLHVDLEVITGVDGREIIGEEWNRRRRWLILLI